MNGMDFDLRVLKPWARDPSFYANVYGEDSDVPEPEGPSIHPAIDLQSYKYPLSKADQKKVTCLIGAIPALAAGRLGYGEMVAFPTGRALTIFPLPRLRLAPGGRARVTCALASTRRGLLARGPITLGQLMS
jgi:hypothetical protein